MAQVTCYLLGNKKYKERKDAIRMVSKRDTVPTQGRPSYKKTRKEKNIP